MQFFSDEMILVIENSAYGMNFNVYIYNAVPSNFQNRKMYTARFAFQRIANLFFIGSRGFQINNCTYL